MRRARQRGRNKPWEPKVYVEPDPRKLDLHLKSLAVRPHEQAATENSTVVDVTSVPPPPPQDFWNTLLKQAVSSLVFSPFVLGASVALLLNWKEAHYALHESHCKNTSVEYEIKRHLFVTYNYYTYQCNRARILYLGSLFGIIAGILQIAGFYIATFEKWWIWHDVQFAVMVSSWTGLMMAFLGKSYYLPNENWNVSITAQIFLSIIFLNTIYVIHVKFYHLRRSVGFLRYFKALDGRVRVREIILQYENNLAALPENYIHNI